MKTLVKDMPLVPGMPFSPMLTSFVAQLTQAEIQALRAASIILSRLHDACEDNTKRECASGFAETVHEADVALADILESLEGRCLVLENDPLFLTDSPGEAK